MEWSRGFMYGVPIAGGKLNVDPSSWNMIRPPVPGVTFVGLGQGNTLPKQSGTLAGVLPTIDAASGRDGAIYMVEYGSGYGNNPLSRLSRLTCQGCSANPAKDFVHTPGVPVVTADQAFRPAKVAAAATSREGRSLRLGTTSQSAWALPVLLLLVGIGLRRRRHVTR
jgi:hypothetical protein